MYEQIASELKVRPAQIKAAMDLLDEGNTVPFIARYRKEATGELKDEELRYVEERMNYLRNLEKRREEVLHSIEEQGKLTDELRAQIEKATKMQELEDLYLPYRPKKKTRASVARARGLEPLAEAMMAQDDSQGVITSIAEKYITEEVPTVEDALQGAMDIIAEDCSDSAKIRSFLRKGIVTGGQVETTLAEEGEDRDKFLMYEEFSAPVSTIVPHQILAINRGEKLGLLKVRIQVDEDRLIAALIGMFVKGNSSSKTYIEEAVKDSFKRLLFPAMERELRNALTEKGDAQAIKVFATNLRALLLQAPLAGHVIMGLDPGYRTGCKMAIINKQGNVLDYGAYYLTHSAEQAKKAQAILADKIRKHNVTLISIGNGTASYETEQFVSKMIEEEKLDCHYIITNEAGASVYSASKLAVEELPDLDVTIRGAVSIARRVQDPMAESVKIDPKSIGVGQYQHDVNQKELNATLDDVIEDVVNYVGVELNTASAAILQHVAGISSAVAKNIYEYRKENGPFSNRKELLKVARLGPAAYTQCAGFLRIAASTNPLDNTPVHPESYDIAKSILAEVGLNVEDLTDKDKQALLASLQAQISVEQMAEKVGAGVPTVKDILAALVKPGRDPREDLPAPLTRKHVMSLDELTPGTVLKGTVTNVVDFGAFIDIGIKTNGLLHRGEFCRRNEHPSAHLAVGDIIDVKIKAVDAKRNRIGLTTLDEKKERPRKRN